MRDNGCRDGVLEDKSYLVAQEMQLAAVQGSS